MSAYRDWHAGMKVVAVRGAVGRKLLEGEKKLTYGQVYTIRELVPYGDTFSVRLVEVVNTPRLYRWPDGDGVTELAYLKECFRPVQKRKTSIAVLQSLLLNPFVKIGEDA